MNNIRYGHTKPYNRNFILKSLQSTVKADEFICDTIMPVLNVSHFIAAIS